MEDCSNPQEPIQYSVQIHKEHPIDSRTEQRELESSNALTGTNLQFAQTDEGSITASLPEKKLADTLGL